MKNVNEVSSVVDAVLATVVQNAICFGQQSQPNSHTRPHQLGVCALLTAPGTLESDTVSRSSVGTGDPSLNGLTRMVSTTNWTPPNSGNVVHVRHQCQITHKHIGGNSCTSRKIRAPTHSTANPRLPNTPARLHAARWWPKESRRGTSAGGRSKRK